MTLRDRVRAFVDHRLFQRFIISVIIVNAIALGCETSAAAVAGFGGLLAVVDHLALGIFVVELAARLYVHRLRFFTDGWNWFDFLVVTVSLLPAGNGLSIVRSLRILRVLRLTAMVPSMRRVINAMLTAIPGIASLMALLLLLLYVGGVLATNLFGGIGDPRFGDLGSTVLTLFQITTGDGWSDVMRDVMRQQPLAWIFFVCYLIVATFTMLNLFIAVVCSAMESGIKDNESASEPAPATDVPNSDSYEAILAEIRKLSAQVRSLSESGESAERPADLATTTGSQPACR